ncbi:MAG TPA: nucleotidyltransferase family protein [Negativicutes bacterium]|nr:nucleotidyltransferase family protein [Negativicutes bacterium]
MIAAIVLAAGAARRMQEPKQLLPLAGRPLVWHAAAAACRSAADDVVVVTGARREEVAEAVADLPVRPVFNRDWRLGQAGSLRAGLAAVRPGTRAVVFLLADQPLVTTALLDSLIDAYRAGGGTIAVPTAGGRRGTPVLFALARWRQGLMALAGDTGARELLVAHPDEVISVPVPDERVFLDVDTPADYEEIVRVYETINAGGT